MARITRMTKRRLGELLGAEGLITEEQLRAALDEQRKSNLFLGEALVKLGFVSEEVIAQTIVQQFSLPFMSAQNCTVSIDVLGIFPQQMYYEYQFIAVDKIANTLVIVGAGLMNHDVLDELERVSKCKVCQYVSTWKDIRATLERHSQELAKQQQDLSPLGSMLLDHTPQPVLRSTLPAAAATPAVAAAATPAPAPAPAIEPFRPVATPSTISKLPAGLIMASASTAPAPAPPAAPLPPALKPATPPPPVISVQASSSNPALKAASSGSLTRLSAFSGPRPSVRTAAPSLPGGPESPAPKPAQPPPVVRPAEPRAAGEANAPGSPATATPKVKLAPAANKTGLLGLFKNPKTETKP